MKWLLEKVLRGLNIDESSTKVLVNKVEQTALSKQPMEPFAVLSLFVNSFYFSFLFFFIFFTKEFDSGPNF